MGIAQRISARMAPELWETKHRLDHALGRPRSPQAVQWMVTQACDLYCEHCYAKAGRRAPRELSTKEAKGLVIDEVAAMGCPLLVLAGGELLLRRDIEELIEYAVSRGLEWAMHTHGGHVPKFEALLRRHPPALAAVSLDGERELHDLFRGKRGSYDGALRAVRVLADTGCREVVFGTTITRQNADQVADLFPIVEASGAHSWGLHLVAPEGRAEMELIPSGPQLRRVAAFARARRSRFPVELCNEWGSAGADDVFYRDRPFLCGAGRISMVVGPTGEVLPCTTTDHAASEGNVRERELGRIWRDGFSRFRSGRAHAEGDELDHTECWLQSRHGVRIAGPAFGRVASPRRLLIDLAPPRLVEVANVGLRRLNRPSTRASATFVHAAAMGITFLSACTREVPSAPPPRPRAPQAAEPAAKVEPELGTLPDVEFDRSWPATLRGTESLVAHAGHASMLGSFKQLVSRLSSFEKGEMEAQALQRPSTYVSVEFAKQLAVVVEGAGRSLPDLLALLDIAERAHVFDAQFAATLWRFAESVPVEPDDLESRATLYGRLLHHQRVVAALTVATGTAGPIEQRPWLKKSAPPRGWRKLELPKGFEDSARQAFESLEPLPWETVGLSVTFKSKSGATDSGPIQRYRLGQRSPVREGSSERWGRLDVMVFPSATEVRIAPVRAGGEAIIIDVPASSHLGLAGLAREVAGPGEKEVQDLITRSLDAEPGALEALERVMPLAYARLRTALEQRPDAPGAAAVRTAMVAYAE